MKGIRRISEEGVEMEREILRDCAVNLGDERGRIATKFDCHHIQPTIG
jgi:hypothetical protein